MDWKEQTDVRCSRCARPVGYAKRNKFMEILPEIICIRCVAKETAKEANI